MRDPEDLLSRLNQQFARPNIDDLDAGLFDGTILLNEIARRAGFMRSDGEASFLDDIPEAMQAALVAFIGKNLSADDRQSITFAWAPSSNAEVTMYYPGSCGHTVMVRTRPPT